MTPVHKFVHVWKSITPGGDKSAWSSAKEDKKTPDVMRRPGAASGGKIFVKS